MILNFESVVDVGLLCYSLILTRGCEQEAITVIDTYESIAVSGPLGNGEITLYITFKNSKEIKEESELWIFFPFEARITDCTVKEPKPDDIVDYQIRQIELVKNKCSINPPEQCYIINTLSLLDSLT